MINLPVVTSENQVIRTVRDVCAYLVQKHNLARPEDAEDLEACMTSVGLQPYIEPPRVLSEAEVREQFKAERQALVDAIVVTTAAGHLFDGDEVSQTRLARAISGLYEGETIRWVLADNSVLEATRGELIEALRLAGRVQEAIWIPQ